MFYLLSALVAFVLYKLACWWIDWKV